MSIQSEFDRCLTFQTLVRDALALVRDDWAIAIDGYATTLSGIAEDSQEAWLAALTPTFAGDRRPAGLDAEQNAAYDEECADLERRGKVQVHRRAHGLVTSLAKAQLDATAALARLQAAKTAYQSGDTLGGGWLVDVMVGCHLGLQSGGETAFSTGPDRTLFNTALQFAKDNAADLLEIIRVTEERPSDPVGLGIFRAAQKRLESYVGTE